MELLNGPVHLVEIDLLRGGPPLPAAGRPDCSYSVLVSRVERRLDAEFWPISLPERLPVIPIPVRAPTRTPGSTCKQSWTGSTTTRGTPTISMMAFLDRDWATKTRTGLASSYRNGRREAAKFSKSNAL